MCDGPNRWEFGPKIPLLATVGPDTSNQIEGHRIAYKVTKTTYFKGNGNDDDLMVTMMSSQIQL